MMRRTDYKLYDILKGREIQNDSATGSGKPVIEKPFFLSCEESTEKIISNDKVSSSEMMSSSVSKAC